MKKIIPICLVIFSICSSILAQTAVNTDNKICNPDVRPAELAIISPAPKNQKHSWEDNHLRLLEVSREPGDKVAFQNHKWPVLYIQKAGGLTYYEEKANANCVTRPLENSLQFPIKMYKGLKLHMNR